VLVVEESFVDVESLFDASLAEDVSSLEDSSADSESVSASAPVLSPESFEAGAEESEEDDD
jgi:hypothetical protein